MVDIAQLPSRRPFFRRRKTCKFTADGVEYIDYKDVNLLRQYVPERAKILPRRIVVGVLIEIRN